jgi:hypothetical protein
MSYTSLGLLVRIASCIASQQNRRTDCDCACNPQVSMIGVHYEDNHVASGFGNHLARPIFRNEWREDLTLQEGIQLLEKCLTVLFYRDRGAINKVQVNFLVFVGVICCLLEPESTIVDAVILLKR